MPNYACRTVTPSGVVRETRVEAASETEVRQMLQGKGEMVVRLKELQPKQGSGGTGGGRKAPADEVAHTIRQMSMLIRAGVPLVEGLRSLSEQVKSPALRQALEETTLIVTQGSSLSEAFARHPGIFSSLAVDMARVAEVGGDLAESLGKLAQHLERSAEIKRKVKAAMAYPIVVVCISFVTVIVLMTFILPRFMMLFDNMGAKIPWTTQLLMGASHIMVTRWYLFVGGAALAVYMFRSYVRSSGGRRVIDAMSMRLPVVGDVVSKIVLGRVLTSIATLLSSGVSMVQTLETAASAADNTVVTEALMTAKRQVAEGVAVSQSLRGTGVFPPLVLQMVASGEKTGELPSMLSYVCEMYDQEVDAKVKSLTSVIEPILIVLLGVIVGFIAVSVIVPIYSLVGAVK